MPNDPEGHFILGRCLLEVAIRQKTPLTEATSELETSLRLDPSPYEIKLQLAEIYAKRIPGSFKPDRMVSLFEDLLKQYPTRFDLRLWYAQNILGSEIRMKRENDPKRVLQDSGWAMELARFHLEKVIDQAPRDSDAAIDARTALAEIQYRSGEWDAARTNYEYLINGFPGRHMNYAAAWNSVGHCHYRKGVDFKAAAEAFKKAWDMSPSAAYQYDIMLAYNKLGGYPRDLPARYRFALREEKYDRAAPPNLKFTDIAPKLHIDKFAGAGPCAWADYNLDGKMDLVACGCDTFCTLYRAEGNGFVDATLEAKLGRLEPGFGAAWADYDNDGDPDLYIARNGWNGPAPNSLLRNNGDGTFTDVAAAAGVADAGSSFHVEWLDYNRDGWLDVIVSNGVYIDGSTNQLYRNNGNGTFTNATAAAGMAEKPLYGTIGVAVGDYDGDGWPDIFYHGRMTFNRLYHNNHDGTFTDVAAKAGVLGPGTQNGYIALFSDLDSDGDLDIFTGSLALWDQVVAGYRADYKLGPTDDIPRFYRNKGDGTFVDASLTAGFRYPLGIMAGSIADLDNDGYQDIYLGTGNPELRRVEPNIFYQNRGGQTFEDLTRFTGLGNLGKGHGITFFDWDGDGDLDVYAELGGFYHGDWWHNAFYLNEQGNRNHWLQIKLQQPEKNRDAIGAHVTVHAGSLHQIQVMTAGRGFGSTDPPILHYGLGHLTKVDRVEIRWPDGVRQVVENPPADRLMTIRRAVAAQGATGG
ncbi:MAG TPA: CRTAC1 family protein [Patescibacteria group bacterium]|nr:CRTAC1 family protein [Patescibacteria group bacterium]